MPQQALRAHAGAEQVLVDRLIEKYGDSAWNHFARSGSSCATEHSLAEVGADAGDAVEAAARDRQLLHEALQTCGAIIGLHADQATDQIAFHGFLYGKPWVRGPMA